MATTKAMRAAQASDDDNQHWGSLFIGMCVYYRTHANWTKKIRSIFVRLINIYISSSPLRVISSPPSTASTVAPAEKRGAARAARKNCFITAPQSSCSMPLRTTRLGLNGCGLVGPCVHPSAAGKAILPLAASGGRRRLTQLPGREAGHRTLAFQRQLEQGEKLGEAHHLRRAGGWARPTPARPGASAGWRPRTWGTAPASHTACFQPAGSHSAHVAWRHGRQECRHANAPVAASSRPAAWMRAGCRSTPRVRWGPPTAAAAIPHSVPSSIGASEAAAGSPTLGPVHTSRWCVPSMRSAAPHTVLRTALPASARISPRAVASTAPTGTSPLSAASRAWCSARRI